MNKHYFEAIQNISTLIFNISNMSKSHQKRGKQCHDYMKNKLYEKEC